MTDELSDRIAELEADNRRLRRLLDQRDAPAELRHRLTSTLAMLRNIVRKSAETHRDVDGYVGHLEDRIDAVMRAQAIADEDGAVDLQRLLVDELFQYDVAEGERASFSGPEVAFQRRAGQTMALVIHELAVNAIEHGSLGGRQGHVVVSWSIEPASPDPILNLVWRELGSERTAPSDHAGYGTEVLTRLVAYELRAEATMAAEIDGFRYTLRFPLSVRVAASS